MKNLRFKYILVIVALIAMIIVPSSCIEDPESAVAGKGDNRFRPSALNATGVALAVYDAEAGVVPLVDIWRDVVSEGELNRSAKIDFEVDNSILDAYNASHPNAPLKAPPSAAVSVVGSSIAYGAGDFTQPIMIQLNPEALDLGQRNAVGIRLKNPTDGYRISSIVDDGEFIVEIIVKNDYDGVYNYNGHIGRFDASSCALIELGGEVQPGVSVTLTTTGVNTVSTVLLWNNGGNIGGIGSSQTIAIDPGTNEVTVTVNGAATPANWGPIPNQPNYYDPETGDIYVSYKWSAPCAGADYGFIRHVRVKLSPR